MLGAIIFRFRTEIAIVLAIVSIVLYFYYSGRNSVQKEIDEQRIEEIFKGIEDERKTEEQIDEILQDIDSSDFDAVLDRLCKLDGTCKALWRQRYESVEKN